MVFLNRLSLVVCYCVTFSHSLKLSPSAQDNNDPQISLIAWISSDTSGPPSSYIKTDVSLDPDQEAPVNQVNSSTYILTSEVLAIGFSCKASYPVEWDFSNKQWMLMQQKTFAIYVTTSRRKVQNMDDLSTYSYEAQLVIYGDSRMLVGNYTCQGMDKKTASLKKDISVFWENGPYDNIFVLSGQNLTVYSNAKDQVIFPCHVHNPNAPVLIQKQNSIKDPKNQNETDTWINWTDPKLKYYPEVGFIFYGNSKSQNFVFPDAVQYRCVLNVTKADDNSVDQDVVYMSYEADSSNHDPELNLDIKSNATFVFNASAAQYICCSSTATPPMVITHSCGDEMSCKQLIPAMKTQFREASTTSDLNSGFNRINHKRVAEFQTQHNASCTIYSGYPNSYELDVVQCIGDGIRAVKMNFPKDNKSLPFGVWDLPKDTLTNWVKLEPSISNNPYKIKPAEHGDGALVLYTGSTVTFRCTTTFYYFSYGMRFSLTTKTSQGKSSEALLPETFDAEDEAMRWLKVRINFLKHRPPLSTKVNFTVTKDLKSLTCNVPVTKNQEWVRKSVKFIVKDPIPPTILAAENVEVVSWAVNATNKTLVCDVSGDPQPFVVWMKDGKSLSGRRFITSHENGGKHVLHIPRVLYAMHGEIQCIAKNFIQDQVSKRFMVFVESSSGSSHTVAIVLCSLTIVGVLIGVGLVWRKLYFQKRQLSGLSVST